MDVNPVTIVIRMTKTLSVTKIYNTSSYWEKCAFPCCNFLTLFNLSELWLPPTWMKPAAGPTLFSQLSSHRKNTTAKQTFLQKRSEDARSTFIIDLVLLIWLMYKLFLRPLKYISVYLQVSKISLVDLAGSERADSTGAKGTRLKVRTILAHEDKMNNPWTILAW